MAPSHLFPFILLLFLSLSLSLSHSSICDVPDQKKGSDLRVFHVSSPCSPFKPPAGESWEESLLRMQSEDHERVLYLSSLVAGKSVVPIASGRQILQTPTYIVRVKIGTPAQTMMMAVDTSNDAAWIPCDGCVGCSSSRFASLKSTSYRSLPCHAALCKQAPSPTCMGSGCSFNMTYGISTIGGNMSQENITLATDSIHGYAFGCIQKVVGGGSIPAQGLLGLGRGPLSLLSQTQSLYKSTFSYCLPSFKTPNFSGSLRLGPAGQPIRIKYTPLLRNPRRSSLYYVHLVGIKVGRRLVDVPPSAFAFNPTTGAGTVFDSGTVFTRLVEPAYTAVRDEFRRRMGKAAKVSSLGGFDTCYDVPITVPTIKFMFQGMNLSLVQDNFLIHSSAGGKSCLAMAASPSEPGNVNAVLNVIANMQQQNHRVLIDVPNSRLGVSREPCT